MEEEEEEIDGEEVEEKIKEGQRERGGKKKRIGRRWRCNL